MKPSFAVRRIVVMTITIALIFAIPAGAQETEILEVAKAVVCKTIANREAAAPGTSFPASTGKLYCYSRIIDVEQPSQIFHVWVYQDEERARVSLKVNPPSWRTYSSKIIQTHETGPWHVDILDTAGNVLKTLAFNITP